METQLEADLTFRPWFERSFTVHSGALYQRQPRVFVARGWGRAARAGGARGAHLTDDYVLPCAAALPLLHHLVHR